jgi:hypothetical protein
MTQRPDIIDRMHKCLLVGNIGTGQPALSLSSEKKSKVAAHGQGGVGKVSAVPHVHHCARCRVDSRAPGP